MIAQLKTAGKKIFVASHIKLPDDVMEKVDFFYYREHNELLTDNEYKGYMSSSLHESGVPLTVYSKEFFSYNSILAVYHLIIPSLLTCKLNGFDIVHMLEYDTDIQDFAEFDKNKSLLIGGDFRSVIYNKDDKPDNFFMSGEFISLDLMKYSLQDLFLNDAKIKRSIRENFTGELTTFDLLIKDGKYHMRHSKTISKIKFGLHHSELALMTCVIVNDEGLIQVFSDNRHDKDRKISVITSNDKVYNTIVPVKRWSCFSVGNIGEVKELTIFVNNKLLKVYDLSSPEAIDRIKNTSHFIEK